MAASTCTHTPYGAHTSTMAATGSMAVHVVDPTDAITAAGTRPAAMSVSMARRSASGSRSFRPSTSTHTTLSRP